MNKIIIPALIGLLLTAGVAFATSCPNCGVYIATETNGNGYTWYQSGTFQSEAHNDWGMVQEDIQNFGQTYILENTFYSPYYEGLQLDKYVDVNPYVPQLPATINEEVSWYHDDLRNPDGIYGGMVYRTLETYDGYLNDVKNYQAGPDGYFHDYVETGQGLVYQKSVGIGITPTCLPPVQPPILPPIYCGFCAPTG